MESKKAELRFMRRALRLAERGRGHVSPNPMVGCVLVKGGRVVGAGAHRRFGGPHAEPDALRRAGARARGATAFVTLEPCCYTGKTPPCTEALIRAGVRRVVAAVRDPNPLVSGKGLRRLRRAGLAVECGLLAQESRDLNRAFFTWTLKKKPWVILKAAASLDGRIATASGHSKWITSAAARRESRRLRGEADAILVGIGTVLADDPRLTAAPGLRNPIRIVLDSRGRTPAGANVLRGPGRTLIATSASSRKGSAGRRLPAGAERIELPRRKDGLDLKALLRRLAQEGISSLLVEGGSAVHTSFLAARLVDEVRLFLAPVLLGGRGARSFFEGSGARTLAAAPRLAGSRVARVGEDILVTGRL